MEIRVTAPNRIDLAGGTTDLYPLYLFMEGGCTVNMGISVQSSVVLKTVADQRITVTSEDLGESLEVSGPSALPTDGALGLIGRAVKAFPPAGGLDIVTHNDAPAGSGLGASSALLIALLGGLLRLRGEEKSPPELVDVAANIEAALIGVPAGKQDHIAAYFGGVSAIDFDHTGFARRDSCRQPHCVERLEASVMLSYTGEGRFSGMNNWDVTKAFIDNTEGIREKLVEIRDVARDVARAVAQGEWKDLPSLVHREWMIRRSLAPGISTPRIDAIMEAATAAGALANKVCGAGGGGCMITLVPEGKRSAVERAMTSEGARLLLFSIDREGLRVAAVP